MMMDVILLQDVKALGEQGEVVSVSDGYFRNFLAPQKLAEKATPGALAHLKRNLERIRQKADRLHQEAVVQGEKLGALPVLVLEASVGEAGRLHGNVTTRQLAELITAKSGITIDRRDLSLSQPINRLGAYTVNLRISAKVAVTLNIEVVAAALAE
jgi:large subunit ribosomal protein L9